MSTGINCVLGEQTPGWAARAVDSITTLVRKGTCLHVGTKDLADREAKLYLLFDAQCKQCPMILDQRLKKDRLCLFVNRVYSSYSTGLLRITLDVEATPSENLRFSDPQERVRDGSSWVRLQTIVVHPIFEKGFNKTLDRVLPMETTSPAESVDAAISVHAKIRTGARNSTPVTLDIPITLVPYERIEQLKSTGGIEETEQMDLTAIVVATSLKILMEDSWRWLKSKVAEGNELISLNIGLAQLTPQTASTATDAAQQIAPMIGASVRDELMGYNRQVDNLTGKKRRLLEEVERASTGVERARTRAEVDEIDRDLGDAREKIYSLLKMHANLQLETKPL